MQAAETKIEDEIAAVEEIIQATEEELSKIPETIKDAENTIKLCDESLLQVSRHIEQQRRNLTIAAAQLHDTTVAYDAAADYLDAAASKTGENAAVHDLKVKKEQYDAAKLNYQKEQAQYDQAIAKSVDLQQQYGAERTQAQSFIDQTHKRRGSLQSAHNQAIARLGKLLYEKAEKRIASMLASLEQKKQELMQLEHDVSAAIEEETTILNRWPDLQHTIQCTLPYEDTSTSILELYRAFLELLLHNRNRCTIEPWMVKEHFHNFDMSLLLELSQGDISAALSDPRYVPSPARIEEKLQDIEKLLQVYRSKH